MDRFVNRLLAAAGVLGVLTASTVAAPVANVYGKSGQWTIEAWTEGADMRMCSATIANPSAQPDFGSFLRLENDGKGWAIVSDYLISGNSHDADMLVDGASFPVRFALEDDVIRAPIEQGMVDAIAAGKRLNLNLDPSGQNFSLRGAQAALDMAGECARGNGLQNVGNAGTNDYNGYNIAGLAQATESHYGTTRGWTVLAATVAGNFAYCTGELNDNGAIWRLGWDGMQWQVAFPFDQPRDWSGSLAVDGDSRSIGGTASDGWTFVWLGMMELDKIRNGDEMNVNFGKSYVDRALVGTGAAITKIEECVRRKGHGGEAAPAPQPKQPADMAGDPICPDGGPRLPVTGICAGRAANYLTGQPTFGEYLADPGCEWVVNDVQIAENALLYRAQRCKGVTAQLQFAGGAHWAQLMVVRSALNAAYGQEPDVSDPKPLVWFNTIDAGNIEQELDRLSRQEAEAELRGRVCAIRKANPSTSPDGYVFGTTPDDPMYAQSREGPTGPQCGPFSEGDGVERFWRVLGDHAFLFDIAPEIYQDIDPNTVTLLRRDGDGNWAAVQ